MLAILDWLNAVGKYQKYSPKPQELHDSAKSAWVMDWLRHSCSLSLGQGAVSQQYNGLAQSRSKSTLYIFSWIRQLTDKLRRSFVSRPSLCELVYELLVRVSQARQ